MHNYKLCLKKTLVPRWSTCSSPSARSQMRRAMSAPSERETTLLQAPRARNLLQAFCPFALDVLEQGGLRGSQSAVTYFAAAWFTHTTSPASWQSDANYDNFSKLVFPLRWHSSLCTQMLETHFTALQRCRHRSSTAMFMHYLCEMKECS